MRRARSVGIIVLAAALCCGGCTYLEDRGNDFLDIVWVDAGYGLGLGIDFQVSPLVQSGWGVHGLVKCGLQRRRHWS